MIYPNVITYTSRSQDLKTRTAVSIIQLPLELQSAAADRGVIDQLRSMPKPNDIAKYTNSVFGIDVAQMVKLLGAFSKPNSIAEITNVIAEIHNTLNDKDVPEIKNWIRILTGLHPEIDGQLQNLGYWSMPYSEVMGTNTIMYYAGTDAVDISYWINPPVTTNTVAWSTEPIENPSYVREGVRQKLNSNVVEMIQNAAFLTTKYMRRNLIWEAEVTTQVDTGNEMVQTRPIKPVTPTINHGVSLNNDWYHQTYRIPVCKPVALANIINHLTSGGADIHMLVNYLTPLIDDNKAQSVTARLEAPLGIEETFPHRPTGLVADVDNSGQKVLASPTAVNNDVLVPEIIISE